MARGENRYFRPINQRQNIFLGMSRTIFIVENEFIIAEDLKSTVERLGYRVVGMGKSAADAMQQLTRQQPELVLLDVQLSGQMEGLQVAEVLNKQDIPFLFVTSYSDAASRREMDATRPLGYLTKPFNQEDVQRALKKAFKESDHRDL